MTASTLHLLGSFNASALLTRPFTIIRTHLRILYLSDQSAASETAFGDLGLIVVKEQATAAGAASFPDPGLDTGAEWFVHEPMFADFLFKTAAGFESTSGRHISIDSKAMRKVGPNEDQAVMFKQSAAVGGLIQIRGRQLVKLH